MLIGCRRSRKSGPIGNTAYPNQQVADQIRSVWRRAATGHAELVALVRLCHAERRRYALRLAPQRARDRRNLTRREKLRAEDCTTDHSGAGGWSKVSAHQLSAAAKGPDGRFSINQAINHLLNRIILRAEMNNPEFLRRAFVDIEEIASGLLRLDHQMVYGRRGTGKTHAISNLMTQIGINGDIAAYIDLRNIGSNNGLYSDSGQPLTLRATRLLIDVIEALHYRLLAESIDDPRFEAMFPHLDAVAEAATTIRVEGPVRLAAEEEDEDSQDESAAWHIGASPIGAHLSMGAGSKQRRSSKKRSRSQIQRSGTELPRLLFGPLGRALESVAKSIHPRRIWVLFDEWSAIPIELQPLLADMLRRVVFPAQGFTVKIATVERRSRFIQRGDSGTYLGLEMGADTAAPLNLDEYLLATEAGEKAQTFFGQLLCRHIAVLAEDLKFDLPPLDPPAFVNLAFEHDAFAEFVRAAEGVPRDALNIVGLAAVAAGSSKIRISHVKHAARKVYLQYKETGIAGNPSALKTWGRLQREVVLGRRSRTFLLRRGSDNTHPAILDLYDARLIHLLRPGLTAARDSGMGYDGYSVDYGSYVHMMDEEHAAAMWDARARPWEYNRDEVYLPDRFDEGVIFYPGRSHN
jgi:hypothetical protein